MDAACTTFLYTSDLAPTAPLEAVADIVKVARQHNQHHHLTGVLVFDGQRFCQYLEGPSAPMHSLLARIAADPRHHAFQPRYQAPLQGPRRFSNWALAYVQVEEDEPLSTMLKLQGLAAVEHFMAMLPLLDMA